LGFEADYVWPGIRKEIRAGHFAGLVYIEPRQIETLASHNMRNGIKQFLVGALALSVLQPALWAAEEKSELKDQKSKVSYGIGMNIGNNLKRSGYEIDVDTLAGAIKDVMAGKELKLTDAQAREVLMSYSKEMQAKREEERKLKAEKNHKEGEAFLAENKKKPDVKTHMVTLPNGKTAEMQYKVLKEGTGPIPGSNDTVTVNYRGTLINGTEFDSSAKRGTPAKFSVNGVIKGWTEALLMMKVGSKWELYIPAALAYDDRGSGQLIEPGATLIFEVELLSAEAPAPPAPAQPLTSDIIKVPSADELKKGAKIEVIKPEDVDKKIKEAQANQANPKK
jgi:FKBP-type peptidyl-prolyl cis-trans isomerase FklB